MADDWQTQKFRQNVITKINEMLQSTGQDPNKNATVMETHIFKKSRSREEYLGLVAKLYMHFKDLPQRKPQPPPPNAEISQQSMMQDPLNALQNLATQGNRNPQMMSMPSGSNPNQMSGAGGPVAASNLLQTLNQQRPGQQMQQMQGIRNQMPINSGMQINVMGGSGQQPQMVGNSPQVVGMGGQLGQMPGGNAAPSGGSGPAGPSVGPNQIQMNAGQLNVNAMSIQQMQQLNQNQMAMGMNHPQLNQMISARMAQSNAMNVGPNATAQGMPGMPSNIQQSQAGQMHPNNVGAPQQVSGPPNTGQPGNLNQMLNIPANIQQKPNMPMTQPGQMYPVNRAGQQQFLRQSPSPSTVPSPAGISASQQQQLQQQQQMQQQQQSGSNQQAPPPQLTNPQMISSPAVVPTSSPQMSNLMQNNQRNMRQSPSAAISTPGQVTTNSPFNPQEDQLYREKYKQLTKYIEPLKRMVAKIGNDGTNTEKITKMSKLLEILCNPTQRVPLETLLKCEKALEKMDIVSISGHQFGKSSNPLLEVLTTTLQSPLANHTLHRTFRPTLEVLFGTDISAPTLPKRPRIETKSSPTELEIPHVLQGEIARLDEKFKVTLDPTYFNNSKLIKLNCCLDDKLLPSVPALIVDITEDYPSVPPRCSLAQQEYTVPFLQNVCKAFRARIAKMPRNYSLSRLLEVWEMSVRLACSPTARTAYPEITILSHCDFKSG